LIEERYLKLLPQIAIPLITDEPYVKLALASKLFAYKVVTKGNHPNMGEGCDIDKRVRFGKGVTLGDNVTVMAGAYIGDFSTVGSNTIIYPSVTNLSSFPNWGELYYPRWSCYRFRWVWVCSYQTGSILRIYQNGNTII